MTSPPSNGGQCRCLSIRDANDLSHFRQWSLAGGRVVVPFQSIYILHIFPAKTSIRDNQHLNRKCSTHWIRPKWRQSVLYFGTFAPWQVSLASCIPCHISDIFHSKCSRWFDVYSERSSPSLSLTWHRSYYANVVCCVCRYQSHFPNLTNKPTSRTQCPSAEIIHNEFDSTRLCKRLSHAKHLLIKFSLGDACHTMPKRIVTKVMSQILMIPNENLINAAVAIINESSDNVLN